MTWDQIISYFGSSYRLGRAISVPQSTIASRKRRGADVPAEWALRIEQASGGELQRHQLRPDLWPGDTAA